MKKTVLFLYDLLHVNFILDMKTENSVTDSVNKLKAEKEVTKEDDEKDKEDNSIDDDSKAYKNNNDKKDEDITANDSNETFFLNSNQQFGL